MRVASVAWAALALQAVSWPAASQSLDFQFYRTHVEPIFLKKRPSGAACFACHTVVATRFRLQPLTPGSVSWTEEQSRRNFEVVSRLVAPGQPLQSRLLLQPLSPGAGGTPLHTGGKFFTSQDDPEWRTLAEWVRTGSAAAGAASASAEPSLDFEFFRTRVQPIFFTKRRGNARCYSCHSTGTTFRLQRLSAGSTSWTEEQSRRNFEAAKRLVAPGEPLASRLLMHPLAAEAGGDPFHSGGKHWYSKDNPEWQTLAAWVGGQKAAGSVATQP